MELTTTTTLDLTPQQVAEFIWNMFDDQQADMFAELLDLAGSEHQLMMQFLSVRDECVTRKHNGDSKAFDAFLAMFSSAYKYAGE